MAEPFASLSAPPRNPFDDDDDDVPPAAGAKNPFDEEEDVGPSQPAAPAVGPFATGADPFASGGDPFATGGDPFATAAASAPAPAPAVPPANPFDVDGDPFAAPAPASVPAPNPFGDDSDPFAAAAPKPSDPFGTFGSPAAAGDPFASASVAPPPPPASAVGAFPSDPFASPRNAAPAPAADPFASGGADPFASPPPTSNADALFGIDPAASGDPFATPPGAPAVVFTDDDPFGLSEAPAPAAAPTPAPAPAPEKAPASEADPAPAPASAGDAAPGAGAPPVDKWMCAKCTFLNDLDAYPCAICGHGEVAPAAAGSTTSPPKPSKLAPSPKKPALKSPLDLTHDMLLRVERGKFFRKWRPVRAQFRARTHSLTLLPAEGAAGRPELDVVMHSFMSVNFLTHYKNPDGSTLLGIRLVANPLSKLPPGSKLMGFSDAHPVETLCKIACTDARFVERLADTLERSIAIKVAERKEMARSARRR